MSRRRSAFAYAVGFLGVIAFASSLARPTTGQQMMSGQQAPVGRYQIATSGSSGYPNLYVIDTITGKIWHTWSEGTGPVKDWVELKPLSVTK